MPKAALTAAQKVAVRKLILAKSDREIARLLRQSYRLLDLHRRRQSNISHREPWTDYELRLLGRIRDEELARIMRRSVFAVAAKRESLGIPIFQPQRRRWSGREIEMLGKRPDAIVARMLSRIHFVNADNKQTVPKVLAPYKKLGVRCAGIVDIDVLNNEPEFKKQLEAAGISEANQKLALAARKKIEDEVNSMPTVARLQTADTEISKMKRIVEDALPKQSSDQQKALLSLKRVAEQLKAETSAWQALKKTGFSALRNSQDEFKLLSQICASAGLFINPLGELEASLLECGIPWEADKRNWISKALQIVTNLQVDQSKQPWKFMLEIVTYLQK